jgi:protein transport protein SEC61 subunit alpha
MAMSVIYVEFGLLNLKTGEHIPFLVVLQLFGGSVILYFMGEILDQFGRLCGTFTLFIAISSCRTILWHAFSPFTFKFNSERGSEFEGSVICFLHLMFVWKNKTRAMHESLLRVHHPNLMTFFSTILVFCIVIYLQSVRVELPVKSKSKLGTYGTYHIKLLSSSHSPIVNQVRLLSMLINLES